MNSKYLNIYTVGLGLAAIYITLLLSSKFTISELFVILLSFVFILLAFNLTGSSHNKYEKFLISSKKYYIAICLLIPFAIFLKMQISDEIPRLLDSLMYSSKSTEIKIEEFTSNGEYQNLFKNNSDNYIIKSQKKTNISTLQVFSFQDICEDIEDSYSEKTLLITKILLAALLIYYFGLFIGVKVSDAVTESKQQ